VTLVQFEDHVSDGLLSVASRLTAAVRARIAYTYASGMSAWMRVRASSREHLADHAVIRW